MQGGSGEGKLATPRQAAGTLVRGWPVATFSIGGPRASCLDFLQNPQQNQEGGDKETLVLQLPPQTSPFLVA